MRAGVCNVGGLCTNRPAFTTGSAFIATRPLPCQMQQARRGCAAPGRVLDSCAGHCWRWPVSMRCWAGRRATGTPAVLWSGQFERDLSDAMAAQSDLALQIGRGLKLPLDASTLAGSGTKNATAWQLFIQALALDPDFARAHMALGEEALQKHLNTGRDAQSAAALMIPHLETALRIDPRLALAHGRMATAMAMAMAVHDDLQYVNRHERKALELDPGDPAGHHWTAELALQSLRVDEALAERHLLVELEPLHALPRLHLAWASDRRQLTDDLRRQLRACVAKQGVGQVAVFIQPQRKRAGR